MAPRISVLIPALLGTAHVAGAVEQVLRQTRPAHEILVLHAASISPAEQARRQSAWADALVRGVTAAGDSPGAWRNAGMNAARGDAVVFVEAGDILDRRYLEIAADRLAARPDAAFVAAWRRGPGPAGLNELSVPAVSMEAILARPDAIPAAAVLRRSAWAAAGRFDEALPSAEWCELWIRLAASGCAGDVVEEPLVGHAPSRGSAYRRTLDTDRHVAGMRAVIDKHLALFREHAAAALCDREETLRALAARSQGLVRRRDGLVAERDAARARLDDTTRALRELGRDAFDWGDLRRVLPVSPDWGYERGTPVDRYYIERFLASRSEDVRGAVLEVQEADYTRRFGGDRVTRSDVVDLDADNPRANLVGDLRRLERIASDTYDCFILTQTVHVIDDMAAVLREARRVLRPGGVLLATLPCASRVCLEYGPDGDFWRVTEAGARQLFSPLFPASHLQIQSFGNVLTATAFLQGLGRDELSAEEFELHDPFHPVVVGVRAAKPGAPAVPRRPAPGSGVVLVYHRIAEDARDVHGLCVPPDAFRAQMAHLAAAYRPVPLIQLAMAAAEGHVPERAVAVTFDDGYADTRDGASPMLMELGIPATVFVTSEGLLGTGGERRGPWWDLLAEIFFGGAPLPERLDVDGVHGGLPTASPAERESAHWTLYHRIRRAGPEERARLMAWLGAWAGPAGAEPTGRLMTRGELEDLARRPGHSVGGHGAHHLSFSAHPAGAVRREVRDNRTLLERILGRPVTVFAYPFGDHGDASVEVVRDAGYRAAVTCVEGLVEPGAHPLRLPRLGVGPRDALPFEERLRRAFARAGAGSA